MSNDDKILSYFTLAFSVIGIAFAFVTAAYMFMNHTIVSSETTTVAAVVVDTNYQKAYITPIRSGKTFIMVPHPERYTVTVRYEDKDYCINTDEATYNKYKESKSAAERTIETVLTVEKTRTGRVKKYMSFKK